MRTADFYFDLPAALIAQHPAPERDQSRLLVLHRDTKQIEHRKFAALPEFFRKGDVLVLNNSRVLPARLRGTNARSGGAFELLLLEQNATNDWWVMLKPGRRARIGTQINLRGANGSPVKFHATVVATNEEGHRRVRFEGAENILDALDEFGEIPLPPYINRESTRESAQDKERYQTVFAEVAGSVAAPTAGLHFTGTLLGKLRSQGVSVQFVTLHVGLGTFAPVKSETLAGHTMHEERYEVSEATARAVNEAKSSGRRVIAVGTTSLRVLESVAANNQGAVVPESGRTNIFIYPPHEFKIADAMLTNFHLPSSTLLMLASAFVAPGKLEGRETLLSVYAEAIRDRYRFFSYGDAMLLL